MGWFDSQIRERQASDEALMADAAASLADALSGRRGSRASTCRSLPARELTPRDVYRFLVESLDARDYAMIVVSVLAVSLTGLFLPAATAMVFSNLGSRGGDGLRYLAPIFAALVGAAVAQGIMQALRVLVVGRSVERSANALVTALLERALQLPVHVFKVYAPGDLAARILSVRSMVELLGDVLFSVGLTVLFSSAYLLQLAFVCPDLAGPAFAVVTAQVFACLLVAYRKSRLISERLRWRSLRSGRQVSLLKGIQKIRLSGADARAFARWAQLYSGEVATTYGDYLDSAALMSLSVVALFSLYGIAVFSGVDASEFMGFAAGYGVVSVAVERFARAACSGMSPNPFMQMIDPILRAVPEMAGRGQEVERLSGRIEFDHVTFSYSDGDAPVLDGLSFKIRPGEYVGIVGRTGSGKSTVMRLLLGFERPQSGAVYYDGRDLNALDVRSLRRHMGVVMQCDTLFAGSLLDNILMRSTSLGIDDAWRAAELAGIADDIRAMPMGMETMVGEGASGLSGGQRQRIIIARAIASNPRILLFDEATSALDNRTQERVASSLSDLRCTRLVVAHRLSTVRDCDRILVLDGGRIAEEGTYDELAGANGLFAELVRRQREN